MISDALQAASTPVCRTPRFEVRVTEVPKRGGGTRPYGIVSCADAVVIVPVLPDGRVVLIRNRRIAAGQVLWEVPAGTLEPGEDPAACALRETEEETGFRPAGVRPLTRPGGGFFPSPGMMTEYLHTFVADGLEPAAQDLDDTEEIEAHPMTLEAALELIRTGELRDAKSIAALLTYRAFHAG